MDKLEQFLDNAHPLINKALNGDKAEFDRIMNGLMEDFLKLGDINTPKRKAPVRAVKKKVRRGIGSY